MGEDNLKKYKNIVVTGSIAYDEIMNFPGCFKDHFHPEKLHQINVSFVVDRLEKQLGGTATNIGYNIRQMLNLKGLNAKLDVVGAVGKDGLQFIDFFKAWGIATDGLSVDKTLYTAAGKVITDKVDNQIWGFYYGASGRMDNFNLKKHADINSLVVISANHPAVFLKFQQQASECGCDYLYDPGMSLTWIKDSDLLKGIKYSRWLVGNDYEIAQIEKRLKTTSRQIAGWGVTVLTTLGEKGVGVKAKGVGHKWIVPAVKIKKVVDPTGAGDAWRGGFVAGVVSGKPMDECLRWANVLASFAVEKLGTVNHSPNAPEFEKRLNKLRQ